MSDGTWFFLLVALGCLSLAAKIISAWRYHRRDLRDLMDDGDGQGGVPPLPREPTRLIKLGDLVAYPELERYAQQKAAQALTEIIGHHGRADASLGDLDPDPGLGGER